MSMPCSISGSWIRCDQFWRLPTSCSPPRKSHLTTLRSTLGQAELDDLLTEREKVNHRLQEIIDKHTEPWGVKVSVVEVKDVDLPEPMKRSHGPPG